MRFKLGVEACRVIGIGIGRFRVRFRVRFSVRVIGRGRFRVRFRVKVRVIVRVIKIVRVGVIFIVELELELGLQI